MDQNFTAHPPAPDPPAAPVATTPVLPAGAWSPSLAASAILVAILAFLLGSFRATNADIWLTLATGKLLAAGEYQFGVDPFSWASAGSYWANPSWLSSWLAYVLYQHIGPASLVIIKASLIVVTAASSSPRVRVFLPARVDRIDGPGDGRRQPAVFVAIDGDFVCHPRRAFMVFDARRLSGRPRRRRKVAPKPPLAFAALVLGLVEPRCVFHSWARAACARRAGVGDQYRTRVPKRRASPSRLAFPRPRALSIRISSPISRCRRNSLTCFKTCCRLP